MVYEKLRGGHREKYLHVLSQIRGQPGVYLEKFRWFQAVFDRNALFSTCDDYFIRFSLLALFRRLVLWKCRTVGISIRAEYCECPRNIKERLKRKLLAFLKRAHLANVISINPCISVSFVQAFLGGTIVDPIVFHYGVVDGSIASSPTYKIAYLGGINELRGANYFFRYVELIEPNSGPYVGQYYIGGRDELHVRDDLEQFVKRGGNFQAGVLPETSYLEKFQKAATIWAYQSARYDQSSGVFYEALLNGKEVIIRGGSYLEKLAHYYGMRAVERVAFEGESLLRVQGADRIKIEREIQRSREAIEAF